MRLQKKSLSRITLNDLLRRRKTNLERFLSDMGIVTYERLVSRCASMGVTPPTEEQFTRLRGDQVHEISSPTEGVVVLNPAPLTPEEEATVVDAESDPSAEVSQQQDFSETTTTIKKKRQRKTSESV